jgi:hypothetical protein
MTPEQQRIAIAEACGWNTKKEVLGTVYMYRDPQGNIAAALPDYLNDLNAMHEAEKTLKIGDEWHGYYMHFVDGGGVKINATAAQRAEAFLRTIGKWKD